MPTEPLVRRSFMRPPGPMVTGLEAFASLLPPDAELVEIGCWTGESALVFLRVAQPRSLVLVDPYDPALCQDILTARGHRWTTCEMAYGLLQQDVLARYPNASHLRMTSVDAAAALRGRLFDCVYIDANHSVESVLADIQAWRPLVKPGGIISGHDYNRRGHGGVNRAVRQELGGPDRLFEDLTWMKQL